MIGSTNMHSSSGHGPVGFEGRYGRLTIAFTILVILLSAAVSFSNRSTHFQEFDSYSVYGTLLAPEKSALSFNVWSYQPTVWGNSSKMSRTTTGSPLVVRIFDDWTPNWVLSALKKQTNFIRFHRRRTGQGVEDKSDEDIRVFLIEQLQNHEQLKRLSPHGLYRFATIIAISSLPLPDVVERALLVPLASSVSIGPALIYSLVFEFSGSYREFLDRATFVTVFLFYISAILLFLCLLRMNFSSVISSLVVFGFIFSISIYSYSFHLGNTNWAVCASSIFLFAAAIAWRRKGFFAAVSWAAAVLVLFSYLILVYYLAVLALEWFDALAQRKGLKSPVARILSASGEVIGKNRAGLVGVAVVTLLFFQPGQGLRAVLRSASEVPDYVYYSVLNYVALFNGDRVVDALQFIAGAGMFLTGAIALCRRRLTVGLQGDACASLVIGTLVIYLGFLIAGLLNITPTRHILFASPIVFMVIAVGLASAFSNLATIVGGSIERVASPVRVLAGLMLIAWPLIGFAAQQARFVTMLDSTDRIIVPAEVKGVIGNAYPITWDADKPIVRIKDLQRDGGEFLYASTDESFDMWLPRARLELGDATLITKIEEISTVESRYVFTAYVPQTDDERFIFMRFNSLYVTLFEVVIE